MALQPYFDDRSLATFECDPRVRMKDITKVTLTSRQDCVEGKKVEGKE